MNPMKRPRLLIRTRFSKFVVIGAFCTLQNIVWLYILTTVLGLHYIVSTVILMLSVNSLGFYLNRKYTFKPDKKNDFKTIIPELLKYHFVMLSSFMIIILLMYILVEFFNVWYILANLIVSLGMTIYNYLAHKIWTFKK